MTSAVYRVKQEIKPKRTKEALCYDAHVLVESYVVITFCLHLELTPFPGKYFSDESANCKN